MLHGVSQVVPRKGTAPLLVPQEELQRLQTEVVQAHGETGVAKLAALRNIVEGWCGLPPCVPSSICL